MTIKSMLRLHKLILCRPCKQLWMLVLTEFTTMIGYDSSALQAMVTGLSTITIETRHTSLQCIRTPFANYIEAHACINRFSEHVAKCMPHIFSLTGSLMQSVHLLCLLDSLLLHSQLSFHQR